MGVTSLPMIARVEDLPWGGWLVSWWSVAGECIAVTEVEPGEAWAIGGASAHGSRHV